MTRVEERRAYLSRPNRRSLSVAALGCALAAWAAPLAAFDINGTKWPGAQTDFYVGMEGVSLTGISWNTAFISAAEEWNAATDFNFNITETFRDPCLNGFFVNQCESPGCISSPPQ